MNMKLQFTKVIQEKLRDKNLSAVAQEIDLPKSVLHDWVNEKRLPSMKNILQVKKLARYIGVTLDELLIGDDPVDTRVISSVAFKDDGREYRVVIERFK